MIKKISKPEPLYKFTLTVRFSKYLLIPVGKFEIFIWEKKKDLHTANGYSYNTMHAVTNVNADDSIELHFWIKRMGLEYTTHELYHAITSWATKNNLTIQDGDTHYRNEEKAARMFGELVKCFYKKLYSLRIIGDHDFIESRPYGLE